MTLDKWKVDKSCQHIFYRFTALPRKKRKDGNYNRNRIWTQNLPKSRAKDSTVQLNSRWYGIKTNYVFAYKNICMWAMHKPFTKVHKSVWYELLHFRGPKLHYKQQRGLPSLHTRWDSNRMANESPRETGEDRPRTKIFSLPAGLFSTKENLFQEKSGHTSSGQSSLQHFTEVMLTIRPNSLISVF